MQVGDRLAAVLAVGVVVVHVGRHRARPVEGDQGGDVVEAGRGERPHQRRASGRPRAGTRRSSRPGAAWRRSASSSRAMSSMSGRLAGRGLDQVEGPLDDREVAQPEEVHLEQAELLDAVHLVLGDDGRVLGVAARLGLALDRAGTRSAARWVMTTAAAWMPSWRRRPSRPLATSMTSLGVGVGLVHRRAARRRPCSRPRARRSRSRQAAQRRVAAHDQRRHGLGDRSPTT